MKNRNLILLITVALFAVFSHCKKDDNEKKQPVELPEINTLPVTEIEYNSAKSGGHIIDDGGAEIKSRGVVWDTIPDPSLSRFLGFTSDGVGQGIYSSLLSPLVNGTKYSIRAYASNSVGTNYGEELNFTTKKFVSFNSEIVPIFTSNICTGCHASNNQGLPDLTPANAYSSIVPNLINLHQPAQSIIYIVPSPNSNHHNHKKYNTEQAALVLKWIEEGALNN